MRGGVVPPALLLAALACLLAFAPRPARLPAIGAALVAAFGVAQLPLPAAWVEEVFLACWASVVATAVMVHLGRYLDGRRSLILAINAGTWAGAAVAITGTTLDLVKAVPWLLLVVPGAGLVATGRGVGVKVVSSWLIAIAVLAAVLPIVPTPGYSPDHLE